MSGCDVDFGLPETKVYLFCSTNENRFSVPFSSELASVELIKLTPSEIGEVKNREITSNIDSLIIVKPHYKIHLRPRFFNSVRLHLSKLCMIFACSMLNRIIDQRLLNLALRFHWRCVSSF